MEPNTSGNQEQNPIIGDIIITGNVEGSNLLTFNQTKVVHITQVTGDKRTQALNELLWSCTVKVKISDTQISTGFFVAPGKILTCVSKETNDSFIRVDLPIQEDTQDNIGVEPTDSSNVGKFKLVLLEFDPTKYSHDCIYLDEIIQTDDEIYTCGYLNADDNGIAFAGRCEKRDLNQPTFKVKANHGSANLKDLQLSSGTPLLNEKTGKVCGIIQSIQVSDTTVVGEVISATTILTKFHALKEEQKTFHQKNARWRKLLPNVRCNARTVVLASFGVTVLVILVRAFQFFEPIELYFYDAFMRGRFNAPKPSDQFLIVTITKQDAEAQEAKGQDLIYSLSNESLVALLNKIKQMNPIAIGLDIYREQALNPQQDQALQTLFETPNLFAVCKVGDDNDRDGISKPPGVKDDQVGFSDFSQDLLDGVLRRQLLAFSPHSSDSQRCSATKSFGLRIAEHYLQSVENIQTIVDVSPDSCQISFSNSVVIPNVYANTGGYQGYSGDKLRLFDGCQILLNYRAQTTDQTYQVVTLEEFLDPEEVPIQDYNNRVILIGISRSDGISDNWKTPYDRDRDQVTPGVIVQAQMIEQVIDIALQRQFIIWVLPRHFDLLLILFFALFGGGLGWWFFSPKTLGIIVIISGASVLIISFVVFQFNGWVPLMPQFLALSATSGYVWWANMRLKLGVPAKS